VWADRLISQSEEGMAGRVKTLEARLALQRQEFQDRMAGLVGEMTS